MAVALTGASGALGGALLHKLLDAREVSAVVVFDARPPELSHGKLRFQPLDLTATSADRTISEALAAYRVEALAHLPLLTAPDDPAYAHEVEAMGTLRVLAGLSGSPVQRVALASTTSVYGASPSNPNHLAESHPLHGAPRSRYLRDKVEMERQVAAFRAAQPDRAVTVLRFAPIVGPDIYDPFAGYLARRFGAVVAGFDPLVQLVHVDDALSAISRALFTPVPGDFNVGSRGVLPLSAVLEAAGVRRLRLPYLGTAQAVRLTNALGLTRTPPALVDFVRYLCVADLRKAERAGLGGQRTIHDALQDFAEQRATRS
jgi:UDP-glucose 4-epimerase